MASTQLTRSISSTGNRKTATFSAWVKKCNPTKDTQVLINFGGTYSIYLHQAGLRWNDGSGNYWYTNAVQRDTSGFYHIVIAIDTTQATASDRVKGYINGVQETSLLNSNYPSQNADLNMNVASTTNYIGDDNSGTGYFDGIMSHVHWIDGTAYDSDDFGETDSTTGIWKPKTAPSVTYGTNGFFLKFENSGSMGTDSSGNSNTFTVNGTMTQTIDTPSNVFATLNPLKFSAGTLSNGNLKLDSSSASWKSRYSTLGVSAGKYYMEFKMGSITDDQSGVAIVSDITLDGNSPGSDATRSPAIQYNSNGTKFVNGTSTSSYFSAMSTNDIIGIALNIDGGTLQFYKNGSTTGSAINLSDAFSTSQYPLFFCGTVYNTRNIQANFGNGYFGTTAVSSAQNPDDGIGIFEFTPPTNYRSLCTKSINAEEYS